MKQNLPIVSAEQLVNQQADNSTPQQFEHMLSKPQAKLVYWSVPLMLTGLGLFTLIAGLIWFFNADLYQIRNKTTGTIFLMKKSEYQKFRMIRIAEEKGMHLAPPQPESPQVMPDSKTYSSQSSHVSTTHVAATVKPKRTALVAVRIAGTQYYRSNLKKAIKAAREMGWYEPYDGMTAKDMREWYADYHQEDNIVFELPPDLFEDAVELVLEPENQFDETAIAVAIHVDDDLFKIGYVSKKQLDRVHKRFDEPDFSKKYEIVTKVVGGNSKWVEEKDDPNDYSGSSSKLVIAIDRSDPYLEVKIFKK